MRSRSCVFRSPARTRRRTDKNKWTYPNATGRPPAPQELRELLRRPQPGTSRSPPPRQDLPRSRDWRPVPINPPAIRCINEQLGRTTPWGTAELDAQLAVMDRDVDDQYAGCILSAKAKTLLGRDR